MCGRIDLHASVEEIAARFSAIFSGLEFQPRYNTPPTAMVPAVVSEGSRRRLVMKRWGLQPFQAGQGPLFNARADKVLNLRRYRADMEKRRCIIPVNGYYEWQKAGKERFPYYNKAADRYIVGLAAFWEGEGNPTSDSSFTIITTNANEALSSVHDRMPVILTAETESIWLNPKISQFQSLMECLVPYPSERIVSYRVSGAVNRVTTSTPECIRPIPIDSIPPLTLPL